MRLLTFALFTLLLQAVAVQAISVQPGQETVDLILDDGGKTTLFLIINSPNQETLTSSSSWVKIEGADSYTLPSGGTVFLKINVSVPQDQAIGDYTASINYGSSALAAIRIRVTIPTAEIETLRALANVNEKISALQSSLDSRIEGKMADIKSQISTIKSDLSLSIQNLRNYQTQLGDLETDKTALEGQIQNLTEGIGFLENKTRDLQSRNEELKLTGEILRSESPVLFVLGFLIGIFGIYIFYRKLYKYL